MSLNTWTSNAKGNRYDILQKIKDLNQTDCMSGYVTVICSKFKIKK